MFKTRTTKYIEHNDVEYEIEFTPTSWVEPEIQEVRSKVVIGYLAQDSSPDDPLTSMDCEGAIYTLHRHSTTHLEMQRALGLDSYWGPDYDAVSDETMIKHLASALASAFTSEEMYGSLKEYTDEGEAADNVAQALAYFIHDRRVYNAKFDKCVEEARQTAWKAARASGEVGEEFRVMLDVYEHSGISYSISGEGMQCSWDTARGAAVWVATGGAAINLITNIASALTLDTTDLAELKKHPDYTVKREAALYQYCKGVLETYNAYLNGDVYGVCVEVFDRETGDRISEDACWGFYGQKYAEEALQGEVRALVAFITK